MCFFQTQQSFNYKEFISLNILMIITTFHRENIFCYASFQVSYYRNVFSKAQALSNANRVKRMCWRGSDALLCLQDATCLAVGGYH